MKDFYCILGVPRDAGSADVKAAYRRLAQKFHPDVNSDCAEWAASMFKDVGEAYEVLSDPAKRRRYDLFLSTNQVREIPRRVPDSPITAMVEMIVGAAAPYVPPDQLREIINRKIAEQGIPQKPVSLVDLAERMGFLRLRKKRKAANRAS